MRALLGSVKCMLECLLTKCRLWDPTDARWRGKGSKGGLATPLWRFAQPGAAGTALGAVGGHVADGCA